MTSPSDPDLVQRCLEGEEPAWHALTDRYADLVYGIARQCGLQPDDAGDVAQEVFVALLRSLARIRDRDRLAGWIARTARREAWRHARRRRRVQERDASAPLVTGAEPLPDEALQALEEEHAVRVAYGTLGERCRRLLDALFFQPDRPYAQIAEEQGMAVGSIGPTRRRCLEQLKAALAAEGIAPDVSGEGGTASSSRRNDT